MAELNGDFTGSKITEEQAPANAQNRVSIIGRSLYHKRVYIHSVN